MNIIGLSGGDRDPPQRGEIADGYGDDPGTTAAPGGGDASDILPEELLERRLRQRGLPKVGHARSAESIRGEFGLLQRELSAKIGRFDRDCEVAFEDGEAIVYRLPKRKDLEYVLDYCEIDDRLVRELVVELMGDIAEDRAGSAPAHPLVIRKPASFRAGERHALARLSAFEDRSAVSAWIERLFGLDGDESGPERRRNRSD